MLDRSRPLVKRNLKETRRKTSGRPSLHEPGGDVLPKIVNIARKHFAQYGFQGTSLKAVASEASVANSLLTYHFKGKEGLFRACIESFAHERMEGLSRLLKDPETVEELKLRIEIFVEEMFLSYLKDPDTFEMLQREVKSDNPLAIKMFEETFMKSFNNVVDFFARAKKRGLIVKTFDPLMAAVLLFSVTCDNAQKNHLGIRYLGKSLTDAKWRKQMSNHIVQLFMSGVIK